jgi:hypothetical protein
MIMKSVEEAFEEASEMMRDAGFEIREKVNVVVDKKLPFMGYSTSQEWKKHLIVVSGFAVNSGMVEGLLIHEMSHIYRIITNHPSHNQRIISGVMGPLVEKGLNRDYQQQALHAIVNIIEDLYADDISFKVMKKNESKLFSLDQMSGFFQNWVKDAPIKSKDDERDKWANASIMLNNSFALCNMERHGIPDLGSRARDLNERFLSRLSSEAAKKFDYFHSLMVNLREDIGEPEFRNLLNEYALEFLGVIHKI